MRSADWGSTNSTADSSVGDRSWKGSEKIGGGNESREMPTYQDIGEAGNVILAVVERSDRRHDFEDEQGMMNLFRIRR